MTTILVPDNGVRDTDVWKSCDNDGGDTLEVRWVPEGS